MSRVISFFFLFLWFIFLYCQGSVPESYYYRYIHPVFDLILVEREIWYLLFIMDGSTRIHAGKNSIAQLSRTQVMELTSCQAGLSLLLEEQQLELWISSSLLDPILICTLSLKWPTVISWFPTSICFPKLELGENASPNHLPFSVLLSCFRGTFF